MYFKPRLNYLEAFIHEMHRYGSLVSTGLARTVTHDVELKDFIIPKVSIQFIFNTK